MTARNSIRSILVAIDLGDDSAKLLRAASDLAAASGADLHVIHAHEEPSAISLEDRDLLTGQRQVHEKRERLLDALTESLPGVKTGTTRVEAGSPANVILATAEEVKADLIVVGPHEKRRFADRYLGSTVERILRQASIPCLILNGPLNLPASRILIPSDHSRPARASVTTALGWADKIFQAGQGEITLTHVLDPAVEINRAAWAENEVQDELTKAATEAQEIVGMSVPVRAVVLQGTSPAETLLAYMKEDAVDLVVMGTHGDSIPVRAVLGSVSSAMVREATIPVMLVPMARVGDGSEPEARAVYPEITL